ncbi:MAG: T9SS type A sorting domain-containing protein, partial [Bacteroidales bacterium]|nr:T9SS type A sorting domain-containing protein [Bacteroidales bacterium]
VGTTAWPLFLYYKYDCNAELILGDTEEALEPACSNNPDGVRFLTVLQKGQTIFLNWPTVPNSPHNNDGFYFNILATYPIDGDVCDNAIPLTLPVINLFGTTNGYSDDYDYSPCSQSINYMDGNDKVYTVTLPAEGYLTGSIIGAFGAIHVLDVCPAEQLEKNHCKAFAYGAQGGQFRKKLPAGSYYVIIANNPPPQTMDFLLNLSWEGVSGVENDNLMSHINVYPNPTSDKFTIEISNDEATDLSLELVTISGQIVYSKKVKSVYSFQEEIAADDFSKGIYYLKVSNGRELQIKKVVVD